MDAKEHCQNSAACAVLFYSAAVFAFSSSVTAGTNCHDGSNGLDGTERCPKASTVKSHTINKDKEIWQHTSSVNGGITTPEPFIRTRNAFGAKAKKSTANTQRTFSITGTNNNKRFDVSNTHPTRAYPDLHNQTEASSSVRSEIRDITETATPPGFTFSRLLAENCSSDKFVEFAGTAGQVTVLLGPVVMPVIVCQWQISVPEDRYMIVKVESLMEDCVGFLRLSTSFTLPLDAGLVEYLSCSSLNFEPALFIPISNVVYFKIESPRPDARNPVTLRVSYTATSEHLRKKLHVVKTSPTWGYVTPPGYDGRSGYAGLMDARYTVEVPEKHTVMISFEQFYLMEPSFDRLDNSLCLDYLKILSTDETTGAERAELFACGNVYLVPDVYNQSLTLHFHTDMRFFRTGFKMRFSLHRRSSTPRKVQTGLFDCSGPNYGSFQDHVQCNTHIECEGREDEGGHCPFSNPACDGSVAVGDKCYTFFDSQRVDWYDVAKECEREGAVLATVKTPEELEAFSLFSNYPGRQMLPVTFGLTSVNSSMPHYYKKSSRWIDNTVNYNWDAPSTRLRLKYGRTVCGLYYFEALAELPLLTSYCSDLIDRRYACESVKQSAKNRTDFNSVSVTVGLRKHLDVEHAVPPFVRCPSGHVTYAFFACHWQSRCGSDVFQTPCSHSSLTVSPAGRKLAAGHVVHLTATFQCVSKKEQIPFSFVCDFTTDCSDRSDEDFCVHDRLCPGFTCSSGQCIPMHNVCDAYADCEDASDEGDCDSAWLRFFPRLNRVYPPAIVNFENSGLVTQAAMNESEPCPDTHFRCPGKLNYCMPVYVLCNGVYDCIGREDEAGCDIESVTCPGFYRCWDSAVCVHPDHICDGWPQCPRHDDELMCNIICPHQCHCQAKAFLCWNAFPAEEFPDLRYLDASGSGMKVEDLTENQYLVFTVLASCRLTNVSAVQLPNVRTLDLSENLLRVISMDVFLLMRSLKVLRLAGNPLVTLVSGTSSAPAVEVESIDISRTQLEIFDSAALERFSSVEYLNISFSRLRTVSDTGFRSMSRLTHLDVRANPLKNYPNDLFEGLTKLQAIRANDFRLCCKLYLPEGFEDHFCFFPQEDISSCQDLIRSDTHRIFLWMTSALSVIGNVSSFVLRFVLQRNASKSGFNIFVTNLCLADLLMGVYLAMVGVADQVYRGQYLWYENTWTSSDACRVAGVLFLLSSEVSAFIICLITLDRFIVLRFPFSTVRFRRKSAVVACVLVWIVGMWFFV